MNTISVIMPVLNEAAVLRARLEELARLELGETIVVDGGSTDGTQSLVTGARLLHSRAGRARQMNVGAANALGEVLLFLHADVSLPTDARAHVEQALEDPSVVGGAFRTWTIADRPTRLGPLLHLADLRSRYSSLPYGDQALFVRASVFESLGGFPELPLMEDLAFSQRLSRAGRVRVVPANVQVSGRRFIEHPVRATFMVNLFPALYRLGVSPTVLAKFYRHVR